MDNPGSNKRIGAAAVAKYRVYKRERNKGCIKRYQKREFMVKFLQKQRSVSLHYGTILMMASNLLIFIPGSLCP
jgi:hypothetical protein